MIDEIIKAQQFKFNLPKETLKAIVMSEYTFLRDIIESGDLESVRIPGLGLFIVKPYRKIKIDLARDEENSAELKESEGDS